MFDFIDDAMDDVFNFDLDIDFESLFDFLYEDF